MLIATPALRAAITADESHRQLIATTRAVLTRGYFCPRFDASARELTDDRAERWVDGAIWSRLAAETCALKEQVDNHR